MNVVLLILGTLFFVTGVTMSLIHIITYKTKIWMSAVALVSLFLCFLLGLLTFKNEGLGQPIPIEKLADNGKIYRAVTEIDTITSWHPEDLMGNVQPLRWEYLCSVTIQEHNKYLTDYLTLDFVYVIFNPKEVMKLNNKKIPYDTHFLIENDEDYFGEKKYCFVPLNDMPKK